MTPLELQSSPWPHYRIEKHTNKKWMACGKWFKSESDWQAVIDFVDQYQWFDGKFRLRKTYRSVVITIEELEFKSCPS